MRKLGVVVLLTALFTLISPTDLLSSEGRVNKLEGGNVAFAMGESDIPYRFHVEEVRNELSDTDLGMDQLDELIANVEQSLQTLNTQSEDLENTVDKKIKEQEKKRLMEMSNRVDNSLRFSKTFTVRATAYGADCRGCSGTTATGTKPAIGRTIAVDPRLIPLGTWVYLEFPNAPQLNGRYRAEDTGGAIKGHKIDLFLGKEKDCNWFGHQMVNVSILN